MNSSIPTFQDFLQCFPTVEPPINLSRDSRFEFAKVNKPFPKAVIEEFIIPMENSQEIDEYTEYEPCMLIDQDGEFTAIIYWRGKMFSYEYILVTYDRNHLVVTRKVIAGTRFDEQNIVESVANISEDLIISIMVGQQDATAKDYDPEMSQSMIMEVLSTGDVIFSLHDSEI